MRYRMTAALLVGTLAIAACGSDSDDSSDDSVATTEAPATTAAPASTDPPATDPPPTQAPATDPPATDPPVTEPPVDPLLAEMLALEGPWTGVWTNTTFGSSGDMKIDVQVDSDAMVMTIGMDLGGNVFGAADPAAEALSIPIGPGAATGTSPTLGDWSITVEEGGEFELVTTNLPAIPAGSATVTGTITGTTMTAAYEVDFGDGSAPAVGTIEAMQG